MHIFELSFLSIIVHSAPYFYCIPVRSHQYCLLLRQKTADLALKLQGYLTRNGIIRDWVTNIISSLLDDKRLVSDLKPELLMPTSGGVLPKILIKRYIFIPGDYLPRSNQCSEKYIACPW